MFSPNEKYILRILFKNKVLASNAQAFESLFTLVMQKNNGNFEQVKPYGNLGDFKNDGFDKTTGEYYQVYAPEDIEKANTIANAENKLNADFNGLYDKWESICKIRKFNYVINDKYNNAPVQVHTAILALGEKYPDVSFKLFLAKDLEDIFMQLSDDDLVSVVGPVPNPADRLDFSALTEVLNHLMNMNSCDLSSDDLGIVPDFEEKIRFNNLSDRTACQLRTASYQVSGLEDFFKKNSAYAANIIQQKIVAAYQSALSTVDVNEPNYGDMVFYRLIELIYPNGTLAIRNSILILMAYYFESCDIFKRPVREETSL